MQHEIEVNGKTLAQAALWTSEVAGYSAINEAAYAVNVLSKGWKYGAELAKWAESALPEHLKPSHASNIKRAAAQQPASRQTLTS